MEVNAQAPSLLNRIAQLRKAGDIAGLKQAQAQITTALTEEIKDTVGPSIQPWNAPHVEKASFPFQVDKQAGIYGPRARAQLAQNLAAASAILVNPQISTALLLGVETRLNPESNPMPADLNDSEFRRFYNDLRGATTKSSNFAFSGTLVNVGWGAGDHVNVTSSSLPAGPKTVSGRLAAAVAADLCDPTKP